MATELGTTYTVNSITCAVTPVVSTSTQILVTSVQLLTHGTIQGMFNMSSGGSFGAGFLSGAASSIVCSMMDNTFGDGGMILAGGLTGGVANAIAGGDFVRGFTEGLIVSALNHAMKGHRGISKGGEDKLNLQKGATIEQIIEAINKLPKGSVVSGEELARITGNHLVSINVDNIQKVASGMKIDLTWTGNLLMKRTNVRFDDGAIFSIMQVGTKLYINNSTGSYYGEPLRLFIDNNSYSQKGTIFHPIFK